MGFNVEQAVLVVVARGKRAISNSVLCGTNLRSESRSKILLKLGTEFSLFRKFVQLWKLDSVELCFCWSLISSMLAHSTSDLTEVNQGVARENVPESSEPAPENNFFWEAMWQGKGTEQNNVLILSELKTQ